MGTVATLDGHVATCGFFHVPCPKQCKDKGEVKCLLMKDLENHLESDCPNRDYKCEHCGKKSSYAFITKPHDDKCRKKVVHCPNRCGDTMERQQVRKHVRTKCLYAVIPCKYKGIGCDTQLKREDMAAHEQDDKHHLHMALETVNLQQSVIKELKESQEVVIDSLQATIDVSQGKSKVFVLSKYQEKKKSCKRFQFPPFYTHPNGYHMALRVYVNGIAAGKGTHVSVYVAILEGEYDAELKWPFIGKVTFTLLNQLEDKNHHIRTYPDTWGHPNFIHHSALAHDRAKYTQYLKDDTLYFRVTVEVDDHKPWLII